MIRRSRDVVWFMAAGLVAWLSASGHAQVRGDSSTGSREFSFVHVSDIHVSPAFSMPTGFDGLRSYPCVSTIKDLGAVVLEPYGVTAPKPSFVLATGDIAEFGFPGVTWEVVNAYFDGVEGQVYVVPGNHDNTWVASTRNFRQRYGGMNYSFDFQGCHFVGICSATLQDPVPSFGEEVVRFLQSDLEETGPTTPVFVFFHHPLHGGEFASRYDVDRILDAMRPYNVVLTLDGHGHSAVHHDDFQLDGVEGGSPFSKEPGREGYNIVDVRGDRIRVAYLRFGESEATKGLLEKTIPERARYPEITIRSPEPDGIVTGSTLRIAATIKSSRQRPTKGSYSIDDEKEGELSYARGRATARCDVSDLRNGAHYLRVSFVDEDGEEYTRTTVFFVEKARRPDAGTALWRHRLAGGSKCTPLVTDGTVYVGAADGRFRALDARTGDLEWDFDAGAEILTGAATLDGLVFFGDGNGVFHALDGEGREVWSYPAGTEIFSSPRVDASAGCVYFGTNDARLIALRASDGQLLWENDDARFSVESKPAVAGGRVAYGAWDGYVYCLDATTGEQLWRSPGPKNQERVVTYHGPADDGPIFAPNGELFVCDRGYMAGRYAAGGEYEQTLASDTSALALSPDGEALYLRGQRTPFRKVDLDGNTIWESSVVAGRLPVSPTIADDRVYVCTNTGHLVVLDDATGRTLWSYQVSPRLYVMAGVCVAEGVAYTVDMGGLVTAVEPPASRH